MTTLRRNVIAVLFAASTACHRTPDKDAGERAPGASPVPSGHVDERAHAEIPRSVRLSPEVLASAKIATAKVTREALVATLSLPGEIVSDPDRSAKISSPVAGRIEQVSFREGSVVKRGDVLALVRVPELGNVRSAYAATTAKAKAARANASRLEALLAERLTSEQAFRDASAEAEALEAEAHSLKEQLAGLGVSASSGTAFLLSLRAPVNGTVLARDAVVGQPITADKTLGSIADLAEVWFLGRVFEKDLSELRIGASTEVDLNAYPDQHFAGQVAYIGQQVDQSARTLTARIVLQNPDSLLRVGLFGTARVAKGTSGGTPRLVVPRTALVEVAGKSVVFVKHPDGDFEMHDVVTGDSAPGKVEIVSGLREGEDVVTEGAFTLKSTVLRGALAGEE
jgi:cobalt-zinc-cadmium efflux system membrane fusion protein